MNKEKFSKTAKSILQKLKNIIKLDIERNTEYFLFCKKGE